MILSETEIKELIAAVEQGAAERVATQGLDEAHTISFACGAMVVFEALGLWGHVPMKWHLYALAGRDPFTGQPLPATPPDTWPVLSITREGLASRGFDISEVDETEMEIIAKEMGDQEHLLATYWMTLDAVAEGQDIPRKKEEDDDA